MNNSTAVAFRCKSTRRVRGAFGLLAGLIPLAGITAAPPQVEADGTVHVPAFLLPESSYLSVETRTELKRGRDSVSEWAAYSACGQSIHIPPSHGPAHRNCQVEAFYRTPLFKKLQARYPDVRMVPATIGGVYTQVFQPKSGVSLENKGRVLINVHGGGFVEGSRTFSHLESVPIASIGRIKVISIDYRMGPDHTFPAASEDVAAVYRELIKMYNPHNIGLYGCSSGAVLTAQSMAWFQQQHMPLPGAIGMFCHGAPQFVADTGPKSLESERNKWDWSDSWYIAEAITGVDRLGFAQNFPYYRGVRVDNPLACPGDYDSVMSKFPPTLFISGSRDWSLSAVLTSREQLTRLGVETDLHVWEGMSHAFFYDVDLPESREAYQVIVRFFASYLGRMHPN